MYSTRCRSTSAEFLGDGADRRADPFKTENNVVQVAVILREKGEEADVKVVRERGVLHQENCFKRIKRNGWWVVNRMCPSTDPSSWYSCLRLSRHWTPVLVPLPPIQLGEGEGDDVGGPRQAPMYRDSSR